MFLNFFSIKISHSFSRDPGIFITDIDKYQTNKRLDIGDRLIQISSAVE